MNQLKRLLLTGSVFFLLLNANKSFGQSVNDALDKPVPPHAVARIEAYRGPGYDDMPVQVLATKGSFREGKQFFFADNDLKNSSDKTVDRVVFSLFVCKDAEPDEVVAQAAFVPVIFPNAKFAAGTELRTGVFSTSLAWPNLEPIRRVLNAEGARYRVMLGITHVRFTDGSEWGFEYPARTGQTAAK